MFDASKWREFRIGDYFDVTLSKGDLKIEKCDIGSVPLISSGSSNNGLVGFIDSKGDGVAEVFSGNKITLDMFCCAYYQDKEFYAVSHGRVNILTPKFEMSREMALFVVTVINREAYKYSYGRAVYSSEAAEMKVFLPATSGEGPDWQYMENYIRTLEERKDGSGRTVFKALHSKNASRCERVETKDWKEFELGEIFDQMYKAEAHVKSDMLFAANKSCDALEFVSRTEDNNGCDCIVSKEGLVGVEKGNAIIIGDTTATMFYQRNDFVAGDHIVVCRSDWMNKYRALFLISVVARNKYRYCYGRAFKMDLIKATRIRLPVTPFGEPDWAYMEKYIRSLPYGDRI